MLRSSDNAQVNCAMKFGGLLDTGGLLIKDSVLVRHVVIGRGPRMHPYDLSTPVLQEFFRRRTSLRNINLTSVRSGNDAVSGVRKDRK